MVSSIVGMTTGIFHKYEIIHTDIYPYLALFTPITMHLGLKNSLSSYIVIIAPK